MRRRLLSTFIQLHHAHAYPLHRAHLPSTARLHQRKMSRTHGHTVNDCMSPTYISWVHMKNRCTNPNFNQYQRYGGRGITFDPRWATFKNFLADMGERPEGTSLDRIDNSGPYGKANCRWASREQQANNRASSRKVTIQGETRTVTQWTRHFGISAGTVKDRQARGWPIGKALKTPKQSPGRPRRIDYHPD